MLDIAKLKNLLGIVSDEKDTILSFILDDVHETILNYCNLNKLPQGLENTAYRMAIDIYRAENIGKENNSSDVTSIKEGDTSVNFGNSSNNNVFTNSILKNYIVQLRRYRKLKR